MPSPLAEAVYETARLVKAAGGRAYLVGGAVRDHLVGLGSVKDADIEVFGLASDALEKALAQKFRFDNVGKSFGVLKVKGVDLDISLPRRESKRGLAHRGFDIALDATLSISAAASRRDFTINAIYWDILTGECLDPFGGLADLYARLLRPVSEKFVEDPLRVLRGMQFVARFDLTPTPELLEVCRKMTPEGLPCERLFEEWAKLLLKGRVLSKGLAFLRAVRWVRYYPELAALIGCKQAPEWHPEGDVWCHTCACLDAFAARRDACVDESENLLVGLAVLCHDFGKPATSRWDPSVGRIRSIGHDMAGVVPTLRFLRRLTNEERILRLVPPLVQFHMAPFSYWKSHAGDAAIRRLAVKVGSIERLMRVSRADDEGRPPFPSQPEALEWLSAAAERLKVASSVPKPILMGRHLMALGLKPGRVFKVWLDACYEAQLDGRFGDLPGAIAFFREHFSHEIPNLFPYEKGVA